MAPTLRPWIQSLASGVYEPVFCEPVLYDPFFWLWEHQEFPPITDSWILLFLFELRRRRLVHPHVLYVVYYPDCNDLRLQLLEPLRLVFNLLKGSFGVPLPNKFCPSVENYVYQSIMCRCATTFGVRGCVALGSWFSLWASVTLSISSDKVRWYGVLGLSRVVIWRESISSYAVASPFCIFPVINYPFHGLFFRFVLLCASFLCVTVFNVFALRASCSASCSDFRRSSFSSSGRWCLFVLWRLLALVTDRPCWLSGFLVRILPPLLSRRRTVFWRVSWGVVAGSGVTRLIEMVLRILLSSVLTFLCVKFSTWYGPVVVGESFECFSMSFRWWLPSPS